MFYYDVSHRNWFDTDIPISTGIACGLIISNDVIYEIVMRKYNR